MAQRRRSLEQLLDNTDSDNNDENFDMIFVPNATTDEYIENENDDDNDIETECLDEMIGGSYEQIFNSYNDTQKLLEKDHVYQWLEGEHNYDALPEEEEIFLTDEQKHSFFGMNFIE